nr:uncharacterized protein LOC112077185 [Salvelinus alpinus]
MSCSYTYPSGTVTSTFWFTKNDAEGDYVNLSDDPDYKGRVTYLSNVTNGHTLTITNLRESDSATYKFRFITDPTGGKYFDIPGVTLSVTDLQVKVTTTWWSTTLTCSTTCTLTGNPTYIWYRNSKIVQEFSSPSYTFYFKTEDSFYCAVKGIISPAVFSSSLPLASPVLLSHTFWASPVSCPYLWPVPQSPVPYLRPPQSLSIPLASPRLLSHTLAFPNFLSIPLLLSMPVPSASCSAIPLASPSLLSYTLASSSPTSGLPRSPVPYLWLP